METQGNEKALRLQVMLEEALKPITDKMENLEQEVRSMRKEQEDLKKLLEERRVNS